MVDLPPQESAARQRRLLLLLSTSITMFLLGIVASYAVVQHLWPANAEGATSGRGKARAKKRQSMLVRVGSVYRQPITPTRKLVGDLVAVRKATIATEVPGKIIELLVDDGSKVVAGKTLIARIDATWVNLEEKKISAQINETRANLTFEKSEGQRLLKLAARKAATVSETEQKQSIIDGLEATLSELQVLLAETRERQSRLAIYAPFDGTVVAKHSEVGEYVALGSPVVDIVSSGRIDVKTMVPEHTLPLLKLGDKIAVKIDSLGMELKSVVTSINPQGMLGSRTFPVRLALDDQEGKLMPGMGVSVYVPVKKKSTELLVPRDAVLVKPDEAMVWILQAREDNADNQPIDESSPNNSELYVQPVPVRILSHTRENYAIKCVRQADVDLVTPGAQVVTEGLERLVPDMTVRIDPDRSPLIAVPGTYRSGQQVVNRANK